MTVTRFGLLEVTLTNWLNHPRQEVSCGELDGLVRLVRPEGGCEPLMPLIVVSALEIIPPWFMGVL